MTGQWIGIGGAPQVDKRNLLQMGTHYSSIADCKVFYQRLPEDFPMDVNNLDVKPGQRVTASIEKIRNSKNMWLLGFENNTTRRRGSLSLAYDSPQYAVEWVFERALSTTDGKFSHLPYFGAVEFTNLSYGVDPAYQNQKANDITFEIQQDGRTITESRRNNSALVINDLRRR